jgi:thiol-disulfide isomerase/thioredoxin
MGIYQPALLSVAGDIVGDEPIVLLEPETWIGKSFPLLDYTDIGAKLKEGEWLALLYHHDCPKCQDAMKQLKAVANQADGLRVALIEMPPYGKTPGDIGAPELFVMSRLLAVKDWFAQTPVLLVLSEGQVVRVGRPESLLVDIVKNVRK